MHTDIHTDIHSDTHTDMHTDIHINIHTDTHTLPNLLRPSLHSNGTRSLAHATDDIVVLSGARMGVDGTLRR